MKNWTEELGNKKQGIYHHAFLLLGNSTEIVKDLHIFLYKEYGVQIKGNPDLVHIVYDSFGIDEGRKIKKLHSLKPTKGDIRIFILQTRVFTFEAQNTLLKMFEEPTKGVHFFIIMDSVNTLLPTLRSRLLEILVKSDIKNTELIDTDTFLSTSVSDRLEILKTLIKEKDVAKSITFIDDLLQTMYKNKDKLKYEASLINLVYLRKCLQSRAPSVKMILEHTALTIPVQTEFTKD